MPLQIPARHISSVGEKRVHAGLRLWRIEEEFSLAVFLLDRVVMRDRNVSEGLATTGAITKHSGVSGVSQPRKHRDRQQSPDREPYQQLPYSRARHRTHVCSIAVPSRPQAVDCVQEFSWNKLERSAEVLVDNTPSRQAHYRIRCMRTAASPCGPIAYATI